MCDRSFQLESMKLHDIAYESFLLWYTMEIFCSRKDFSFTHN